jgi:hypothetical protein
VNEEPSDHGPAFWAAVAVGVAVMGWGTFLFLEATPDGDRRINFVVFLVGADLTHDLVIAPLVCLVGVALARVAPTWLRAPVQAGLVASACVLAVAWLPLWGTAEPVGNPSIQPLDYTTATLTVLAVVWAAALVWAATRWRA